MFFDKGKFLIFPWNVSQERVRTHTPRMGSYGFGTHAMIARSPSEVTLPSLSEMRSNDFGQHLFL